MGFEENEISSAANGGTEIAKRKLSSIIDPELLKEFQIICSRPRELQEDKIRIFWAHDLAQDPESAKFRDRVFQEMFHKFVFISNWQYSQYQLVHGIPYDEKSIVLESGIEPAFGALNVEDIHLQKDRDIIRLVYTSTPQRGLEILVPVFEVMAERHPNIHLDVFSSFKIYGWDEADKQFEPLYDRIRNHPKMTYHGFVPNKQVKEHLNKSHIFAYPCIWTETSCRAMLEAMSAGLVCVHPNYGALPETSGGLNVMYQGNFEDRSKHANIFANHLNAAINFVKEKQHHSMISFNKTYVDSRYNINRIKSQWEMMLKDLISQYPTPESRKKKEVFVYKT
jgi:glycosyltransferase involved in cell wall biosynthesis